MTMTRRTNVHVVRHGHRSRKQFAMLLGMRCCVYATVALTRWREVFLPVFGVAAQSVMDLVAWVV